MTIEQIKKLADWNRELRDRPSRSYHVELTDGSILRLIGVGRKWLRCLHNDGTVESVDPARAEKILGL